MDLRGTGASFGADYVDSWRTGHDIAQIVEWIAAQPWSTEKIGMVGIVRGDGAVLHGGVRADGPRAGWIR